MFHANAGINRISWVKERPQRVGFYIPDSVRNLLLVKKTLLLFQFYEYRSLINWTSIYWGSTEEGDCGSWDPSLGCSTRGWETVGAWLTYFWLAGVQEWMDSLKNTHPWVLNIIMSLDRPSLLPQRWTITYLTYIHSYRTPATLYVHIFVSRNNK